MPRQAIASLPLFQGLSPAQVDLLAAAFQRTSFSSQTVIFNQGEPAEHLYILLSGQVVIRFKPHDGEILTVTEISPGGVFGWSAALGRMSYTSCAVCTQDSQVLFIQGDELRDLCANHPETGVVILERLAGVIAQRLCSTHETVVSLLSEGLRPDKDESG